MCRAKVEEKAGQGSWGWRVLNGCTQLEGTEFSELSQKARASCRDVGSVGG